MGNFSLPLFNYFLVYLLRGETVFILSDLLPNAASLPAVFSTPSPAEKVGQYKSQENVFQRRGR